MKIIIKAALLLLILIIQLSATIINVPADQPTIQAGVNASSEGDTVLVADGTYSGVGNYNITIGGHNLTLMSENGAATCNISPGIGEYQCFILSSGPYQSTIIDGFTLHNVSSQGRGAGVFCSQNRSPIIRNCVFSYMLSYSNGGAIYLSVNSNATIQNCVFENNTSYETGSAICCYSNMAIIENCIFSDNSANRGGAIASLAGGSPLIRDCEFDENHAFEEGGSIYLNGGTPEVSNCTIINSWMSSYGGGIFCDSSANAYIHHCTISNNSSMEYGNGICCRKSDPTIAFCLFNDNREYSMDGGGIACIENSHPLISNCTFYRNMAEHGGAIFSLNSTATIINSLLWYNETDGGYSEIEYSGDAPVVSYCDVRDGWPGEGNIDCDPLYCTGNFYLQATSCCAGMGENQSHIGAFGIGCGGNYYFPGDANMYEGAWPPAVIGSDVTYLVNYFRSLPSSHACLLNSFFCSADANGDCLVVGSDVTKLVDYFRGLAWLECCPDYPAAWLIPADLPHEAPAGWPNCETPVVNDKVTHSGASLK